MLKDFISELGKRLDSENDLSDITWALLQSSSDFRRAFLTFIGINNTEFESAFEFEREYLLPGNLRVDLAIRSPLSKEVILLENKIWDRNYHFVDYSKAIGSSSNFKLVLLSAHQIESSDSNLAQRTGWTLRYWHDFEESLRSLTFKEFDDVRAGFISYLRRVCMVLPVDRIQFDSASLNSLYSFNNLIRRIVKDASHDNFVYALYPSPRSFSNGYSACYYSIAKRGEIPFTYPAIGIDYQEDPSICVWLDRDWNKIADSVLIITPKKTDLFEIENEVDSVIFCMLPELFKKFNTAGKVEQAKVLQDFFRNTNMLIEKAIEGK